MKKIFTLFTLVLFTITSSAQHYVGMDLSMLPKYEEHNKPYLDKSGNAIPDVLKWLPSIGVNTIRVRLFVDPSEKNPSKPEGVCQDLEYVKKFGARIKAAGLLFMLDFHYSDTWADPAKQNLPASWKDCTTADQKAARLYTYTSEVLDALNAVGARPDFVQVGNEISYGMIGISVHPYDNASDNWAGFFKVLESGCKAVREKCPQAKIIIHTERSGNAAQTSYYYKKLATLDYDVIGLSYYPFWHGKLSDLENTLKTLAKDFPKKEVQVVETAYYNNWFPVSDKNVTNTTSTWKDSEAGQKQFLEDLIATLEKYPQVNGINYWFPEEAGNGDDSWKGANAGKATVIGSWLNRGLWNPEENGKGHMPLAGLFSLQHFAAFSAIENVSKDGGDCILYNILGQRVSQPQKGQIYIRNGKKYIHM